jgi:hypothetical protein
MGRLATATATVCAGLAFSVLVWWALVGGVAGVYGGLGDLFSFTP